MTDRMSEDRLATNIPAPQAAVKPAARRILLFAGTTEGRRLAEALAAARKNLGKDRERDIGNAIEKALVCVATEYGETLLKDLEGVTVLPGRLGGQEMEELIMREGIELILDATHPYAREASANISEACGRCGRQYLRVLREPAAGAEGKDTEIRSMKDERDGLIHVSSTEEAAAYLDRTEGNVLLTTGSKEIAKFCSISNYQERLYPRVLPLKDSLEACLEAGIQPSHVICMQGPFTRKMNEATLEQIHASYMVTKESGRAGGFGEKLAAAAAAGVTLVVIGRPEQETGYTVEQVLDLLGLEEPAQTTLTLVGIGPGSRQGMTLEAREAIRQADICFGAPRMLEILPEEAGCEKTPLYLPGDVIPWLLARGRGRRAAVLLSGDVGFFSGAKKLLEAAAGAGIETRLISGVSSAVYFLGRLGIPWEQVKFASLHGRQSDPIAPIRQNRYTFLLMAGQESLRELCRTLLDFGLDEVKLSVGENLSYPEERLVSGGPEELLCQEFQSLLVVLAENEAWEKRRAFGIPDNAFIRDKVPMTKSEIRAVSLARLALPADAVVYDIGAGTGSVSIEIALQACEGRVYAIEKNPDGVRLMEENRRKFKTANLVIIEGKAPEAIKDLEAATHVFIGGSSGQMKTCIEWILKKNPACRIVINAITLETLSEVLECEKILPFAIEEISQVSVARARQAGPYHMMTGQNPVYIITAAGRLGGDILNTAGESQERQAVMEGKPGDSGKEREGLC